MDLLEMEGNRTLCIALLITGTDGAFENYVSGEAVLKTESLGRRGGVAHISNTFESP